MLNIKFSVIMNLKTINEKNIFSQIPTNLMIMFEGTSFLFMIGYKICT